MKKCPKSRDKHDATVRTGDGYEKLGSANLDHHIHHIFTHFLSHYSI